jgi:hypothetical protein
LCLLACKQRLLLWVKNFCQYSFCLAFGKHLRHSELELLIRSAEVAEWLTRGP